MTKGSKSCYKIYSNISNLYKIAVLSSKSDFIALIRLRNVKVCKKVKWIKHELKCMSSLQLRLWPT